MGIDNENLEMVELLLENKVIAIWSELSPSKIGTILIKIILIMNCDNVDHDDDIAINNDDHDDD